MGIDLGGVVSLALAALFLALYAIASRVEAGLAAARRRDSLQEAIARRPTEPETPEARPAIIERERLLAMFKNAFLAGVVLSGAAAGLFLSGDDSLTSGENWIVAAAAGAAALACAGLARLAVDLLPRMSRGINGEGEESLDAALGLAGDNGSSPLDELDEHEVRMIRGVVELDTTMAREIMSPRVDVKGVDISTPLSGVVDRVIEAGHSRLPVYRDDLDNIEGLVYAMDLLRALNAPGEDPEYLTPDMLRKPLFIPDTKKLEELLTEFQRQRVHMAIVIDEYGGVAGLVTIEDLLEEIVGEIQDEFDQAEPGIDQTAEGEFVVDASAPLDALRDRLGVDVKGQGFDTVGGLVYDRLGKIPTVGEEVVYGNLTIRVVSTVGRRLRKLRVTRGRGVGADVGGGR